MLLVDTYDVEQGIRNAITVGLEMRERGERLAGIRIDSGDLAWLAKMARRMLDEAGLGPIAASCCPTIWTSTPSSPSWTKAPT